MPTWYSTYKSAMNLQDGHQNSKVLVIGKYEYNTVKKQLSYSISPIMINFQGSYRLEDVIGKFDDTRSKEHNTQKQPCSDHEKYTDLDPIIKSKQQQEEFLVRTQNKNNI